jgi:hypothetical protein
LLVWDKYLSAQPSTEDKYSLTQKSQIFGFTKDR